MSRRALLALIASGLLAGCEIPEPLQWQALRIYLAVNPNLELGDGPRPYETRSERLVLVPVVDDLEFPWDVAFPDAETALVTEKPGRLSRIALGTGTRTPIACGRSKRRGSGRPRSGASGAPSPRPSRARR